MLKFQQLRALFKVVLTIHCIVGHTPLQFAQTVNEESTPEATLAAIEFASRALSLQGEARQAEQYDVLDSAYRDLIEENEDYFPAVLSYAGWLTGQGKYSKAAELLEHHTATRDSPEALRLQGELELRAGNTLSAASVLTRITGLLPDSANDHFHLANVLSLFRHDLVPEFGQSPVEVMELAINHYSIARELAPGSLPLARAYAESFYILKEKRWPEALAAWQHAGKLDTTPFSRVHQARVLIELKQYAEAKAVLQSIDNPNYLQVKQALLRKINRQEAK